MERNRYSREAEQVEAAGKGDFEQKKIKKVQGPLT
jgi:hypothetical protein